MRGFAWQIPETSIVWRLALEIHAQRGSGITQIQVAQFRMFTLVELDPFDRESRRFQKYSQGLLIKDEAMPAAAA